MTTFKIAVLKLKTRHAQLETPRHQLIGNGIKKLAYHPTRYRYPAVKSRLMGVSDFAAKTIPE